MGRRSKKIFAAVLLLPAFAWAVDEIWLDLRKDPTETIKVDRFYKDENRWGQFEYSIGSPENETCVVSLFPHHGRQPCWYVKKHQLREVDTT